MKNNQTLNYINLRRIGEARKEIRDAKEERIKNYQRIEDRFEDIIREN